MPTYTWASIRIRRGWRLFALAGVALLGAALLNEPWWTLLAISAIYLALLPFSIASYAAGQAAARSAGRAGAGTAAVSRGLKRIVTGPAGSGSAVQERPSKRGDDLARRRAAIDVHDQRRATKPNRARVTAVASIGSFLPSSVGLS